ncbi:hypothetical protein DSL72_002063 [Monilinia vaccinii-corymbosi]|uniref:Carbohydrate esterase family 16 protein n=1 Tax=Monilinia vaccinii-corymbosi TaxID=61207 RepID=A0A8A3PBJ4_9HELO|nr:hypothetical protein DSL72_002063 [Monilinia vaccinii-corymbosi]
MVFISSKALPLTAGLFFSASSAVPVANTYYSQCVEEPSTASTSTPRCLPSTHAAVARASASSSRTKYLMVFGDSYSSDGFFAGTNTPSAQKPLGIPLPGTTTDGGLGWLGVVATKLNSSLILGFDYAEYGATTDKTLVRGATHDFVSQVNEFQTYTAHNASSIPWTAENTMAVVWMGINDVGNSFWDGFATPFDKIFDRYFAQLQHLYDAGIRFFTLFTVPPFDQAPVFTWQSAQNMDHLRANITTYNAHLASRFAAFERANKGVKGKIFNTSASFYTALKNPSAYHAKDATCTNSDGTTCLWYDNYHPGQAIQTLVAQNFVKALTGTFFSK